MTCTILKGNLEKFLKVQENLNFLQKFENLKVLQAEFQAFKQFWAIWRSKIGICEKCLRLLPFEFLREILCKSDLPKFCEFDKFLGCSTQICPSLRVFIFKQWIIAISCFGKKSTFLNPQKKIPKFYCGANIGWIYQNMRLIEKIFTGRETKI